jgi:signal transduction histidine kinase
MGALVSGVVEDFRPLAQDEGVSVDTQLNAEQLEANVDPHRMSQVLSNLLSNAVRHAGQGSVVTIGVGRYGTAVEVSVSDTGPGIDPQDLPHVFERFYRVDRSRSRSEGGSGLGLAIAKEVVEAHGGRIWAESNRGERGETREGAVFTFRVPLRPDGSEPLGPDTPSLDKATRRTLAM